MKLITMVNVSEKIIHQLSRWIRFVSGSMLFLMMFFVAADVFGRYFINKSIKGDIELQELMMVLIVFLALPYNQLEKGNIFVELLVARLKGRTRAILESFTYLVGFVIIIFLVWQLGLRAFNGITSPHPEATTILQIPIPPFILVAVIGLALMGVEWLIDLIHSIIRTKSKLIEIRYIETGNV